MRNLAILTLAAAVLVAPDPAAVKVQGPDTLGNSLPIQSQPPGTTGTTQTPVVGNQSGAASTLTATLTGAVGKFTYITGFEITGGGATAASIIVPNMTGTLGSPVNYVMAIPAGATAQTTPLIVTFTPPLQSSAVNTNIVINVPSFGVGNTGAAVVAHGFLQ